MLKIMKNTVLFTLLLIFSTNVFGQRFLAETRETFDHFGRHITKVVIPSTTLPDMSLRDAVEKGWKISPYEFCTMEEYEEIKMDNNYFFLMRVDGKYRREMEPGLEYITLIRGGAEIRSGMYSSHDIITLPLQPINDWSGTYLNLLPAYIEIFQNHIYRVQKDITLAFKGDVIYSDRVGESVGKMLMFSLDVLGFDTDDEEMELLFRGHINMVSSEDIEEAIVNNRADCVVPVTIAPDTPGNSSYSYKILIDTGSHELLFYRRHRITNRLPSGFTREDMKRIAVPYQF